MAVLRSVPAAARRLGIGVAAAAVVTAAAYAPVWLYLPAPTSRVRLLPLVPSF